MSRSLRFTQGARLGILREGIQRAIRVLDVALASDNTENVNRVLQQDRDNQVAELENVQQEIMFRVKSMRRLKQRLRRLGWRPIV